MTSCPTKGMGWWVMGDLPPWKGEGGGVPRAKRVREPPASGRLCRARPSSVSPTPAPPCEGGKGAVRPRVERRLLQGAVAVACLRRSPSG